MKEAHRKKVELMRKFGLDKGLFKEPFDEDVISVMRYYEASRMSKYKGLLNPEKVVDMTSPKNNPRLEMIWRGDQKDKINKIEYLD